MNAHLVDQSRCIDDTNKRLDSLHNDLLARIDDTNKRIDDTNKRMDFLRAELVGRIDETNRAIARLYEVIVRREEHQDLALRLRRLEQEVEELKKRLAA